MSKTTATKMKNWDVIVGRGNHQNEGNVLCQQHVQETLEIYYSVGATQRDRMEILETIYDGISESGGRFMEAGKDGKILDKKDALDKLRNMFSNLKQKKKRELEARDKDGVKDDKKEEPTPKKKKPNPPKEASPKQTPAKVAAKAEDAVMEDVVAKPGKTIVVAKNRIPKGTLSQDHALSLIAHLPFPTLADRQAAAMILLQQIQKEKDDIKEYSKNRLAQAMIQKAQSIGLKSGLVDTGKIQTVEEIVQSWMNDSSEDNQHRLYQILYQQFQGDSPVRNEKLPWLLQAEKDYMRVHGWTYAATSSDGDKKSAASSDVGGFIYDIMYLQLNNLQSRIKTRGEKKHGIWISPSNERFKLVAETEPATAGSGEVVKKQRVKVEMKHPPAVKAKTPTRKARASKTPVKINNTTGGEMPVPTRADINSRAIPSTVSVDHSSLVTEGTLANHAATSTFNLEDATTEQLLAAPPAPDVTFREVLDAIWEGIIGANGERKLPLAHFAAFSGIMATIWIMYQLKPAYHVVSAFFG